VTVSQPRPPVVKRPRYRPGAASCAMCQDVVTYDQLRYRNQREPGRAVVCDECAERLGKRGLHGHG
jgi:hypothetical protein